MLSLVESFGQSPSEIYSMFVESLRNPTLREGHYVSTRSKYFSTRFTTMESMLQGKKFFQRNFFQFLKSNFMFKILCHLFHIFQWMNSSSVLSKKAK